jgi:hypothetical protein
VGEQNEQSGADTPNAPAVQQPKTAADRKAEKATADQAAQQATDARTAEGTFTRDRVLGERGDLIVGAPHHVLAGALSLSDAEDFTRGELQELVDEFLGRAVTSEEN